MQHDRIPLWKTAPFARLILPLIAGIILQWYLQFSFLFILFCATSFAIAFILFYFLSLTARFQLRSLQGILLMLMIICFAMFITWHKDIRHDGQWFGHLYNDSSKLVIRINEPLTEKSKSFKAEGYVEGIINNKKMQVACGKIFLYFSKDSLSGLLKYGDKILIKPLIQPIKNSGNPGAFNYERYASFQQAFHLVHLKSKDFIRLPDKNINSLNKFIFFLQKETINILQVNISGDKNVLGIAEALLIGYKEDLDKDLVQAYSNAGVVHIIAISGLHLGLIYVMLVWIFNRLPLIKRSAVSKVILILSCLWLFSLLTGASASVLRSAVMFTCIVIGKNFFKQSSIYNSLGASAFILLCYDPYFLWDVGFQLSYLAIIGIVAWQKAIVNLFYFKNRLLNNVWNMLAVTFAAQLTTFPICIYYFHQFPNLFFITNLIAVPLSTLILFAEIFIIAIAWVNFAAQFLGKITGWLVWLMNSVIQSCNAVPFSLLDNIYANVYTTWILYAMILCIYFFIIDKNKFAGKIVIVSFLAFLFFHTYKKICVQQQKKIIIYNVPKCRAIDFIYQDKFYFNGDTALATDGLLQNFHLKPARISLQANAAENILPGLKNDGVSWQFFNKKVFIIDSSISFAPVQMRVRADVLIISKNPSVEIANLVTAIQPSIIVFDASNSLWKIANWKKDCLALDLPCFSIPEQGAFILDAE